MITEQSRNLLSRKERIKLFAGVYDALSARIAEEAGFDGVWVSGYSVAAAHLGTPDIGLTTLTEMVGIVEKIANTVNVPVIVDGEVGYGNALNVMRAVRDFESAGAIAMQIGDEAQESCPYIGFPTKLLPVEEMGLKLRAALEARSTNEFKIIVSPQQPDLRALQYLEYGADGAILPYEPIVTGGGDARQAKETLARLRNTGGIAVAVTAPFLPMTTVEDLQEAGFDIMVLAAEALFASVTAQKNMWSTFIAKRSTHAIQNLYDRSKNSLDTILHAKRYEEFGRRYLPADYSTENTRAQYAKQE